MAGACANKDTFDYAAAAGTVPSTSTTATTSAPTTSVYKSSSSYSSTSGADDAIRILARNKGIDPDWAVKYAHAWCDALDTGNSMLTAMEAAATHGDASNNGYVAGLAMGDGGLCPEYYDDFVRVQNALGYS